MFRVGACPFAPDDPRHLHGFFSTSPVVIDHAVLDRYRVASEVVAQRGNLRTIATLVEMLDG